MNSMSGLKGFNLSPSQPSFVFSLLKFSSVGTSDSSQDMEMGLPASWAGLEIQDASGITFLLWRSVHDVLKKIKQVLLFKKVESSTFLLAIKEFQQS